MKGKDSNPSDSEVDKVSSNNKTIINTMDLADMLKKMSKESAKRTAMYVKSKMTAILDLHKGCSLVHVQDNRGYQD